MNFFFQFTVCTNMEVYFKSLLRFFCCFFSHDNSCQNKMSNIKAFVQNAHTYRLQVYKDHFQDHDFKHHDLQVSSPVLMSTRFLYKEQLFVRFLEVVFKYNFYCIKLLAM